MELEQSGGARKSESQCRKSEAHPGEAGKWAREEREQLEFQASLNVSNVSIVQGPT